MNKLLEVILIFAGIFITIGLIAVTGPTGAIIFLVLILGFFLLKKINS